MILPKLLRVPWVIQPLWASMSLSAPGMARWVSFLAHTLLREQLPPAEPGAAHAGWQKGAGGCGPQSRCSAPCTVRPARFSAATRQCLFQRFKDEQQALGGRATLSRVPPGVAALQGLSNATPAGVWCDSLGKCPNTTFSIK